MNLIPQVSETHNGSRACAIARLIAQLFSLIAASLSLAMGRKGEKDGHGLMNVVGLAKEWDASEEVRERVRGGKNFLHEDSAEGEDIPTVVLNKDLITPMVVRMAAVPAKKPHPPIDGLTEEVEAFFRLSKRVPLPAYSELRKLAWRLRYLVSFVKAKARRGEPSTEPRTQ